MSAIPAGNRRTVLTRSEGLCERCAAWLANTPADIHQDAEVLRKPVGGGGIHGAKHGMLLHSIN